MTWSLHCHWPIRPSWSDSKPTSAMNYRYSVGAVTEISCPLQTLAFYCQVLNHYRYGHSWTTRISLFSREGELDLPDTWQHTFHDEKAFHGGMYAKYSHLHLYDNKWKVNFLASRMYSSWIVSNKKKRKFSVQYHGWSSCFILLSYLTVSSCSDPASFDSTI